MTVRGALYGGNVKSVSRVGDLGNKISIGSAAVFLAKDSFKESVPYSQQYDANGDLTVYINLHFIAEVRRQLSGDEAAGTSTFSPAEKFFWDEYIIWVDGTEKFGEMLIALTALDKWLVDEVRLLDHNDLNRDYEDSHKWNKTFDQSDDYKGIRWL